jgi:hypothetical protein
MDAIRAARLLAFDFRCLAAKERRLPAAGARLDTGVPFPLHGGKRTPVSWVAA